MKVNVQSIFWKEMDGENGAVTIKFDKTKLIEFLHQNGFYKKYLGKERIYIKETGNIIDEVSAEQIQDFVVNLIRKVPQELLKKTSSKQIETALVENFNILFSKNPFSLLHEFNKEPLRDTKYSAFFTFRNVIVEVTKDKILYHPYDKFNACIWKKQIINHDFELINSNGDFQKFILNICGGKNERFFALVSSIGYLLHTYKDPSITKAVIYCDEDSSSDLEGRTGKSLVVNAVGKLRNCLMLDGKNSKVNESFSFQQVELSTQIINFNDVSKTFNFESLFSILTEGIKVEKKYRDSFYINYENAPKIVITTNHTIIGKGGSFEDRMFEVEFSPYYSKDHKPINDFGRLFFMEWNKDEWDKFYSFMIVCVKFYLKNGLKSYPHINLPIRKLTQEIGEPLMRFFESLELNTEYDKKELYEQYIQECDGVILFGQRTFTNCIKDYAKSNKLEVVERFSNGKSLIKLIRKTKD
ncbi:MAG: hypothetical protein M1480_13870 [Bacteroidetes bacterium]|nr:hypothetical protein [Bacteroidota bacterium]